MLERPSGRPEGRIVRAPAEKNPGEIFFARHELRPHLERAGVCLTRGGKLSFGDTRIGQLAVGERDGVFVSRAALKLNGGLQMFEGARGLEDHVRSIFNQAFHAALQDRADRESRKIEIADALAGSDLGNAVRSVRHIVSKGWGKIASVMTRTVQIPEDECEEN